MVDKTVSNNDKLTITALLLHLRQTLLDAREAKDEKLLSELASIYTLIEDAALGIKDRKRAAIAEEMRSAVRDILMGTEWKSNIPSVNDIEEAAR